MALLAVTGQSIVDCHCSVPVACC